jgi:hypothetical protein
LQSLTIHPTSNVCTQKKNIRIETYKTNNFLRKMLFFSWKHYHIHPNLMFFIFHIKLIKNFKKKNSL